MKELTVAELLEFFDKAEKLNLVYSVRKNFASGNFHIDVEAGWLTDEWAFSSDVKVIVAGNGMDTTMGDYSLAQMNEKLDERLDRERRREELLRRLTDEEKGLLNLKD